jgi:hypothetical protein
MSVCLRLGIGDEPNVWFSTGKKFAQGKSERGNVDLAELRGERTLSLVSRCV